MRHRAAGWGIRFRTTPDNPGIEAVFGDCLLSFPWRGTAREELARLRTALNTHDCLVAHEPHVGIIGFLVLDRPKAYVSHLFVDRDWRFCGVGAGLLGIARDMARAPLLLDVDVQNTAAMKAYRAMGWVEKVGPGPERGGQRRLSGP